MIFFAHLPMSVSTEPPQGRVLPILAPLHSPDAALFSPPGLSLPHLIFGKDRTSNKQGKTTQ